MKFNFFSPPSGPATGSSNGFHHNSKFLAVMKTMRTSNIVTSGQPRLPSRNARGLRLHRWLLAGIMLLPFAPASGAEVAITDYFWYRQVYAWTATFDSVPILLNGQTYQTGPITMSLDPAYPMVESHEIYDFRDMSFIRDYRLLVSSPLLADLGVLPQHFHMVTTGSPGSISVSPGTINDSNWTTITVNVLQAPETTGTFDAGQLLSGWIYHNCGTTPPPTPVKPDPGETIKKALEERNRALQDLGMHDATLTDPSGTTYTLATASGTGRIEVGPIPEPQLVSLVGVGLLSVLLARRRLASC